MAVKITAVDSASPADRAGVRAGDVLASVNGHEITDVLDYMFYAAEEKTRLALTRDGAAMVFDVEKGEYEDLGLAFETFLMSPKQSCKNKCVFCFIDQMPKGLRETLYFKDDDARLSFLQGNYITLMGLDDGDIDRIIKMRLSVNISVHTTNPELRCKMMGNRFAGEKLGYLKRLAKAGITLNCQIVLCPKLNDGAELERTLGDLGALYPSVRSVAVVPVGLTKHRDGLPLLERVDKGGAERALAVMERFGEQFLEKHGTRLVFAADEFYLTAGKPIPPDDYYEDYSQYENGVGMLRSFRDEFISALDDGDFQAGGRGAVCIATGTACCPQMKELVEIAAKRYNIQCNVIEIKNEFFGESVTVAGLLTAGDIIRQLDGKPLGDRLLIAKSMLNADGLFLDGLTVRDVEQRLGVKIRLVENDGYDLLNAMIKE